MSAVVSRAWLKLAVGVLAALAPALAAMGPSHAANAASVTAACATVPGADTSCRPWYTANVRLKWSWSPDDASVTGLQGCGQEVLTSDTRAQRSCQVTWGDQSLTTSVTVKVDKTPPNLTSATPARAADVNGWYTHPVRFDFTGADATSGIASCPSLTFAGPDGATAALTGTCQDVAGNTGSKAFSLAYDATPPVVTAVPDRPPDANGWYRRRVVFQFHGTDSASGIDSCTTARYAGPDGAAASVIGSCTDNAGNTGTLALPLHYDATPPSLRLTKVLTHRASATLGWSQSRDTAKVIVTRSPGRAGARSSSVYSGDGSGFTDAQARSGTEYRYDVRALDAAGNAAVRSISLIPGVGAVLRPGEAAWVSAPPLLRWNRAARASYYNVQLFRLGGADRNRVARAAGSRKVMSTWPGGPRLRLHRRWRYAGRRERLSPGRFRWFVWAGYGSRAAHHYGPLLGTGTFRVVR